MSFAPMRRTNRLRVELLLSSESGLLLVSIGRSLTSGRSAAINHARRRSKSFFMLTGSSPRGLGRQSVCERNSSVRSTTLPINCNNVIAIIEDDRFDWSTQFHLEVFEVPQAGAVVIPWMNDQGRLLHLPDVSLHPLDQPA